MAEFYLLVYLPPETAHLSRDVTLAGGVPVLDLTCSRVQQVPSGAWVRILPNQIPLGEGPVILCGGGDPVPGRETWLEVTSAQACPPGFAGLILRGREAGGPCGKEDGLLMLSTCPRAIVDAGLGPDSAAAAAALGARGVVLSDVLLGLPELRLPAPLARRVELAGEESTRSIHGFRVLAPPLAPVLRHLARPGTDPWKLAQGWWEAAAPNQRAWPVGQGVSIAGEMARRYLSLKGILQAFRRSVTDWRERAMSAEALVARDLPRCVTLRERDGEQPVVLSARGQLGSGVLWQWAAWEELPVEGEPLVGAMALGGPVCVSQSALRTAQNNLTVEVEQPAPAQAEVESEPAAEQTPSLSQQTLILKAPLKQQPEPVVIVGMGCRFPGASSLDNYWRLLVERMDGITPIPKEKWDAERYWSADRREEDKTYSRLGGFLNHYRFQGRQFRLSESQADALDAAQKLSLTVATDALDDAGLLDPSKRFERSRVGVYIASSSGEDRLGELHLRARLPEHLFDITTTPIFARLPPELQKKLIQHLRSQMQRQLPKLDDYSLLGSSPGASASRVAATFRFTGPCLGLDASSGSLGALQVAVQSLQEGACDIALAGGIERSMGVGAFIQFSKMGLLSPDRAAPYDASARGFLLGEGGGILVLKRLSEAYRDGDRVYARIRGLGSARGGEAGEASMDAQRLVLRRAYANAGLDPVEVDLFEGQGLSLSLTDKAEVQALTELIGGGRRRRKGPARLTAVSSQIGYLRAAAGIASTIKAVLALHHKMLLPSMHFREARPELNLETVPLQVQEHSEPWEARGAHRRAGVSSYSINGLLHHLILEEYDPTQPLPSSQPRSEAPSPQLPAGLWGVSAMDRDGLDRQLRVVEGGGAGRWSPRAPLRLVAASSDAEEQLRQAQQARRVLHRGRGVELLRRRGVYMERGASQGSLALLFPGDPSEGPPLSVELLRRYAVVEDTFIEGQDILRPWGEVPLMKLLEADPSTWTRAEAQALLMCSQIAQTRLLAAFGCYPDMVAGHSLGEFSAAVASGMLDFHEGLSLTWQLGQLFDLQETEGQGMIRAQASLDLAELLLSEVPGDIKVAGIDSPRLTTMVGSISNLEAALPLFRHRDQSATLREPVTTLHTPHAASVRARFDKLLLRSKIRAPRRPVSSSVNGGWFPMGPQSISKIRELLLQVLTRPTRWMSQTRALFEAGARIYVELGPGKSLGRALGETLERRPHRITYLQDEDAQGVRPLLESLAALSSLGLPIRTQPMSLRPDLCITPLKRYAIPGEMWSMEALPSELRRAILHCIQEVCGVDVDALREDLSLEGDLGLDPRRQVELMCQISARLRLPSCQNFAPELHPYLGDWLRFFARQAAAVEGELSWESPEPKSTHSQPSPHTPSPETPPAARESSRERPAPAPAPEPPSSPSQPEETSLIPLSSKKRSAQRAPQKVSAPSTRSPLPAPAPPAGASAAMIEEMLTAQGLDPQSAKSLASALMTPLQSVLSSALQVVQERGDSLQLQQCVCSGVSIGIPGNSEVFSATQMRAFLEGDHSLLRANNPQTIPSWEEQLHQSSRLIFTTGLEALREASLPLIKDQDGGRWLLPGSSQERVGILLATTPHEGQEESLDALLHPVLDKFRMFIGAQGPCEQVREEISSISAAILVARRWLREGSVDHCLILGVDQITGLPGRPLGTIGFLMESDQSAAERGVTPLAELQGALEFPAGDPQVLRDQLEQLFQVSAQRAQRRAEDLSKSTLWMGELDAPLRRGLRSSMGGLTSGLRPDWASPLGPFAGTGIEEGLAISMLRLQPDRTWDHALRIALGHRGPSRVTLWHVLPHQAKRVDFDQQARWLASMQQVEAEPEEQPGSQEATETPGPAPATVELPSPPPPAQVQLEPDPSAETAEGDSLEEGWIFNPPEELDWLEPEDAAGGESTESSFPEPQPAARVESPPPATLSEDIETSEDTSWALDRITPASDEPPELRDEPPEAMHHYDARSTEDDWILNSELPPRILDAELPDEFGWGSLEEASSGELPRPDIMQNYSPREEDLLELLPAYSDEVVQTDPGEILAEEPDPDTDPGTVPIEEEPDELPSEIDQESLESLLLEHLDEEEARPSTELPPIASPASPPEPPAPEPEIGSSQALDELQQWLLMEPVPTLPDPPTARILPSLVTVKEPRWLSRPFPPRASLEGRVVRILGTGALVEHLEREILRRGGSLEGFPDTVIDAGASVLEVFELARSLVEVPPRDWLCITLTGEEPEHAAFEGSRAGFTSALSQLWKDTVVRILDLPASGEEAREHAVCDELASHDGCLRIRRRGNLRETQVLVRCDRPVTNLEFTSDQMVLVTGGATGMGARVVQELIRRGVTRVLILEELEPASEPLDWSSLQEELERSLARGSIQDPEREKERLFLALRREEIRANLAFLRNLGVHLQFLRADLRDPRDVHQLLRRIQADWGALQGCIHALAPPRPVRALEHSSEDFLKAYSLQAQGGLHLVENLPDDCWFLALGPVAGRFGCSDRLELAAGEEAMAQICSVRPQSLHLSWAPWRSDLQTPDQPTHGVHLLSPSGSAALCVDWILNHTEGQRLIAGNLGSLSPPSLHPFFSRFEESFQQIHGSRKFSPDRDVWLRDHAPGGYPSLCLSVGVELLVAASSHLHPEAPIMGLEAVEWLKDMPFPAEMELYLEVQSHAVHGGRFRCLLSSSPEEGYDPTRVNHLQGTVLLGDARPLEPMPAGRFVQEPVSGSSIYQRFFHGPAFQVLQWVEAVAVDGIQVRAKAHHAQLSQGMLSSPLLLEAALQAAALHGLMVERLHLQPKAFESLRYLSTLRDGEPVIVRARRRPSRRYDVDVEGPQGVVMMLRGLEHFSLRQLDEEEQFEIPEGGWATSAFR